jgi:hypothetical protein
MSVWTEKYLNLATVSKDYVKIMILVCNLMTNHEYLLLVNTAFNSIPAFLLTFNGTSVLHLYILARLCDIVPYSATDAEKIFNDEARKINSRAYNKVSFKMN